MKMLLAAATASNAFLTNRVSGGVERPQRVLSLANCIEICGLAIVALETRVLASLPRLSISGFAQMRLRGLRGPSAHLPLLLHGDSLVVPPSQTSPCQGSYIRSASLVSPFCFITAASSSYARLRLHQQIHHLNRAIPKRDIVLSSPADSQPVQEQR